MSESFSKEITIGQKYGPAMKITDQSEAEAYFEKCVEHNMSFGQSRQEAERINRLNLGYYAGYYDDETRVRVERLFRCSHPIFGAFTEPEDAFHAGFIAACKDTRTH